MSRFDPTRRARMRRLRTVSLIITAALFAASCGGAGLPVPATADPLAGQYIVNGGGGALDNVRALTDAFGKLHPAITWQGGGRPRPPPPRHPPRFPPAPPRPPHPRTPTSPPA